MSVVNHPNPMRGPWEGPLETTAAGNLVDDRRLKPGYQPCRLVSPTLTLIPIAVHCANELETGLLLCSLPNCSRTSWLLNDFKHVKRSLEADFQAH